jgi:hypothetical protein
MQGKSAEKCKTVHGFIRICYHRIVTERVHPRFLLSTPDCGLGIFEHEKTEETEMETMDFSSLLSLFKTTHSLKGGFSGSAGVSPAVFGLWPKTPPSESTRRDAGCGDRDGRPPQSAIRNPQSAIVFNGIPAGS